MPNKHKTASDIYLAMDSLREVARWHSNPGQFIETFDPHAEFKKAMDILNKVNF